jgi:hypothetical protein
VIHDPVGGDVFDASTRCLAWEGRLLTVGFASGRIPEIAVNRILLKNIAIIGVEWPSYHAAHRNVLLAVQDDIWAGYREGALRPVIWSPPPRRSPRRLAAIQSLTATARSSSTSQSRHGHFGGASVSTLRFLVLGSWFSVPPPYTLKGVLKYLVYWFAFRVGAASRSSTCRQRVAAIACRISPNIRANVLDNPAACCPKPRAQANQVASIFRNVTYYAPSLPTALRRPAAIPNAWNRRHCLFSLATGRRLL